MQTTGATAPLRVITPEEHTLQTTQTDGMVRRQVVAAPGTWIGITHTPARCASGWHHHGEYETYIGVQSGTVRMEFGSDGQDSCEAKAGDFIHVPQGAVHREINPGDTENVLLIIRVGSGEPVFNVDGPAR
jgi:uncharacterized RmlC-like cupin family protein